MFAVKLFEDDKIFFRSWDWRKATVIIFLAVQLVLVVAARFTDERAFCWAPHDQQTEFELTVFINGRELGQDEIDGRFRVPYKGRDPRGVGNIKHTIMQHCRTYGKNDEVFVVMEHTINGIRQEPWKWHHYPQSR